MRLDELPAQRAARGTPVKDFEITLAFDDGLVRHVLGYGTPLLDPQGRPRGAVAVLVDITSRKQAEDALRASEERYRQLFQSLQEGFYLAEAIFDEHGACCDAVYLDVNPAFERIMGLPRAQIVGKHMKTLVPGLKPEWLEVFGTVTRTGAGINHQSYSDRFEKYFEAFVFRPVPGNSGCWSTTSLSANTLKKPCGKARRACGWCCRPMRSEPLRSISVPARGNGTRLSSSCWG